jgi:hypothetical protein
MEDGGTIVVKAYIKRGDESHIAEAEVRLGSDGGLAVDYLAARLQLRGKFRVSAHRLGAGDDSTYLLLDNSSEEFLSI